MSTPEVESQQPAEKKRSRKVYVFWGVALAVLATATLTCWGVVLPFYATRDAVARCALLPDDKPLVAGKWMQQAPQEIGTLGGPGAAASRLRLYLRLPDSVAPNRFVAACLLCECGEAAIPKLRGVLADSDPKVRRVAARTLKLRSLETGDTAPLLEMLEKDDPAVRREAPAALGWLGRQGEKRALPALLRALNDSDAKVRAASASALAVLGDSGAIDGLAAALDDGEKSVREEVVRVLGDIGGASAIEPLTKALRDRETIVRRRAATEMGRLADEASGAVEALERLLKDENMEVRLAAARALRKIRQSAAK